MSEKKTLLEKEWGDLRKKEERFLKKRSEKKESFLNRQLAEHVPDKLQNTLNLAFAKAFGLIFQKGTGIIHKTFDKEKVEQDYKIDEFTDSVRKNRKTLRTFEKKAKAAGNKNLVLSGAVGIGMGIVGVGLPDIPVFTAELLRSIYEIALRYGFTYEKEEERWFILMIIRGAVSYGETVREIDDAINSYIKEKSWPDEYRRENLVEQAAEALSGELLYMKFLQGIPVVGAVGGAYDAIYMKQITEYANLKYRRRFLENRKN